MHLLGRRGPDAAEVFDGQIGNEGQLLLRRHDSETIGLVSV